MVDREAVRCIVIRVADDNLHEIAQMNSYHRPRRRRLLLYVCNAIIPSLKISDNQNVTSWNLTTVAVA